MPLARLEADEDPVVNMAPMIDVILVLTIFFMCATKFSDDERRLDLDLPRAGAAAAGGRGPEIVDVEASGAVRYAGEAVEPAALSARLAAVRAAQPELTVMIRGEREVSHGRMVEVYEACRGAGAARVAIAVRSRGDGSPR